MVGTSNDSGNLAILCATHHELCHNLDIEVIGIYPSTKPPNNRTLIYKINGKANIEGIEENYFKKQLPQMKVYYGKKE